VSALLGQDLIWKILVASHSDPLFVLGDSLRLGMGFTDLGGVMPHPQNQPVILEGENRVPPPIVRLRFWPASQGFFSEEVEAGGPFSFETRVFSNLGTLVAHWKGRIEGPYLTDNIKNPATGTYTLRLGWNARGNDGERAGTGAYIWKVRVKSLVQPGMGQAGAFVLGYLRKTGN